jgi:hypothetical protein
MSFGGLEVHRLIYLPEAILEASPGGAIIFIPGRGPICLGPKCSSRVRVADHAHQTFGNY